MTRSHKLILASALVAGGYAVALLLGSISNWLWPDTNSHDAVADDPFAVPILNSKISTSADGIIGARLVPESAVNQGKVAPAESACATPTWLVASPGLQADESFSSQLADAGMRNSAQDAPDSIGDGPSPWARITSVKSRQETLANDPSPWDRWPRWDRNLTTAATEGDPVQDTPPAVAKFEQAAPLETRAIQVSYDNSSVSPATPPDSGRQGSLEPVDTGGDLRTHILIDGDSLARLADRYLDDPALGDEIFRLNRDVLDDPELLPIGVELRIPDRRAVKNRQASSASLAKPTGPAEPVRLPPVDRWTGARSGSARPQLFGPEPPTWSPAIKANQ